ncbi:hypothetical protein MNEG_8460 [Monoraphidium neglectum]|uniref:Uncharacterized protein n=1 Tax=Monoraphidium neglectum TaxID=145388 RepID=A0A0D2JJL3_9CHLO|nr:hypothetical protein MNEG_8460 [Monoraphidium neglectum]KIY99497.1 hypothetical protein MNEG_8460 [Monoraphidium neglectum]|eukprot:XP_013898517.1 hypothetical protein MNEG_8460 [Monoraphidium neglectum]
MAKSSGARVLVLVLLVAQCASRSLAAAASSKASSGSSVDLVVAKAVAISTAAPARQQQAPGAAAGLDGGGAAAEAGATEPERVPQSSGWWYAGPLNPAALREVAKSLQMGRGVEPDHRLSLELFKKAADLGDPEAHGQMGLRHSVGLARPENLQGSSILRFDEASPDEPRALLHYYFGAAGGDTLSRLALAYRHTHGAGVPKSCWSAAAYYQPAAEGVVTSMVADGGVPQMERIRLNLHANAGMKLDRHRDVLQYFQNSADQGNVNAQAAIGKVLNAGSYGVPRDPKGAQHYLRRAADAGDADAMAHLGHMHASGLITGEADYKKALKWFTESVGKKVSPSGLYGLGYLHFSGRVPTGKDLTKASKLV